MATAEQVLAVARSQLGTVEDAQGRQKFGAWYGMDGVAWCAIFTQWCFAQVGASGLIPRTAYTPTYYQWFLDHGQAGKTPRVGALVFYDWPDSVHRIQHVGIVEAVNPDGSIITIEGNTTSGAAGDQSNGGGVWRRRRTTSAVVGYGYPAYAVPAPVERPSPDIAPTSRVRPEDPDLMTPIDIFLGNDGTFRGAAVCEAGSSSSVIAEAWLVFGVLWGGYADVRIAFLDDRGAVMNGGKFWEGRVLNNRRISLPAPDGCCMATVEGTVVNAQHLTGAIVVRPR